MQLSQALSSAGQSAEALEHADRALALTDAGKDDVAAFGAQLQRGTLLLASGDERAEEAQAALQARTARASAHRPSTKLGASGEGGGERA